VDDPNKGADKSTELAEQRTSLAVMRTVAAADRTLMAWVRTSISMIGFGFTIYKFLQYLREGEHAVASRPEAPRNFGLALIALGTASLAAAIWEHSDFLKQVGLAQRKYYWSLSVIVAILVILIGVIAFVGVLLRAGPF
jgi:putative membrane protein